MEGHIIIVVDVITTVADGITTIDCCYCHVTVGTSIMTAHDLLCFFVADGITTCLADVIAIMADGIAIYIYMYRLE